MRCLSRSLHALFALWFAVILGDPGVLHSCAMHGAGHGAHGVQVAAPSAMSHDMSHDMSAMAHEAAPADSHERAPAHATCTCVGHCCATTASAPLPAAHTIELPTLEVPHVAPSQAAAVAAPQAPDHRLPFANGPPAV
jgi:hypothetical protein